MSVQIIDGGYNSSARTGSLCEMMHITVVLKCAHGLLLKYLLINLIIIIVLVFYSTAVKLLFRDISVVSVPAHDY